MEEGNSPHPWFPRCDMLVPWQELNGKNTTTAQCAKGVERKRQQMEKEEMR